MSINNFFAYIFTNSNIFSNTYTHTNTNTITSTNTNTNTNMPLIEWPCCKGFTGFTCQKAFHGNCAFQMDFIQRFNPSTLPGGQCLPGRTPLCCH